MITNTIAKWLLIAFGIAIILINGILTLVFGYVYLGQAFGGSELADYAGAFYALLILDVGYVSWYLAFKNNAETNGQRALAAIMAVIALLGSIGATLNQLAVNSFGLVDLTAYHDTVGLFALVTMLVVTALHIVATAAYSLLANSEWARQTMINIKANMLDASLKEAESRVKSDADLLVDYMAAASRAEILAELGFTTDVKPAGKDHQAAAGGGLGYKTKVEATGGGLFKRSTHRRDQQIRNGVNPTQGGK